MVEIIPKEVNPQFFSQKTFLSFGVIAFIVAVSSFFVIQHLSSKASKELERLETILSSEKTKEERVLESRITLLDRKVEDFGTFTTTFEDLGKEFEFLEMNTHSQVAFTDAVILPKLHEMKLEGTTQDFSILQVQVAILKKQKELQSVGVKDLKLGEKGQVEFALDLVFSPDLFK